MAGPIRKDEISALETLKRGPVKRDSDGGDSPFQSLSQRGMAEEKRGIWQLTTRGKVTLQRKTGVRRGSR
jgi:hypothetical protein